MKNKYFGDFGDYQKFSLLKSFRDIGEFSIVVHWMKTKDDLSSDGKRITYLNDVKNWEYFDKDVFGFLKSHINQNKRDLLLYEQSVHARDLVFINDHIEDPKDRKRMLEVITQDSKSDLIFFDPDNGIEVKSINSKNLHKYVLWSDIQVAFKSGKSVLIYQHFGRQNREAFISGKLKEMKNKFKSDVIAIQVKYSVYFVIVQKRHSIKLGKVVKNYKEIWEDLVNVKYA